MATGPQLTPLERIQRIRSVVETGLLNQQRPTTMWEAIGPDINQVMADISGFRAYDPFIGELVDTFNATLKVLAQMSDQLQGNTGVPSDARVSPTVPKSPSDGTDTVLGDSPAAPA